MNAESHEIRARRGIDEMKEAEKEHGKASLTAVKKPYVKPAFRSEQVFETTALTCGKTNTEGQCHLVIKKS